MIELTKLNGEIVLVNPNQIEYVELIPESKLIMTNGKYHLVAEDKERIKAEIIEFYNKCIHKRLTQEE